MHILTPGENVWISLQTSKGTPVMDMMRFFHGDRGQGSSLRVVSRGVETMVAVAVVVTRAAIVT